jgi:hypothetical protein
VQRVWGNSPDFSINGGLDGAMASLLAMGTMATVPTTPMQRLPLG